MGSAWQGAAPSASPEEFEALTQSAGRKAAHGDGAGCLVDVERILKIKPQSQGPLSNLIGQCEMLVGKCQQGKKRIVDQMIYQNNTPRPQAESFAEALASVYCVGGDSTPRDQLLHALHDLSDGAFSTTRTPRVCLNAYDTVRQLAPQVPPKDQEDTQVREIPKTLYHMAARCLARAGDCANARRVFHNSYPDLPGAQRPSTAQLDTFFRSVIEKCGP